MNNKKIILDLCGGTGSWSKPYKEAGYNVKIVTLPTWDVTDEKTVQFCIEQKPYGILCASPCECWGLMGNCRWKERTREFVLLHAEILIKNLRIIYESNPTFWCIENPPGKMRRLLGQEKYQFDPYDFGESYHIKTLLWGKFSLPVKPELPSNRPVIKDFIRWGPKDGRNKSEVRAITPPLFAKAFYDQNL